MKGEDGSFNQLKEWSEEIHDDNKTVVGLVDRARRAGPEKLPAE